MKKHAPVRHRFNQAFADAYLPCLTPAQETQFFTLSDMITLAEGGHLPKAGMPVKPDAPAAPAQRPAIMPVKYHPPVNAPAKPADTPANLPAILEQPDAYKHRAAIQAYRLRRHARMPSGLRLARNA